MAQKTQSGAGSAAVIEDVGPSRKKLTITIPGDAVAEQIETSMAALMSEAALPGFRPGRVPRQLVERRFGKAVRDEAKNQLVASAYSKAVEDHKLTVLGEPDGGEELKDLEIAPGQPITFSVEVEVPPQFEVPSLDKIEVKRPIVEVTDQHVNDQLERLKQSEGELEPREKTEPGDYCIGRGVMKKAKTGETILEVPGAVIQNPPKDKAGKGAILGLIVDDFDKQIGSPKKGDKLSIKAKGPDNHESEDVRGEDLVIEYEVERVERIIPATVEQLVEKFGMQSDQQLREVLMLRLNQRALLETQTAQRQQVANYLLEKVSLELPERITARQAARNLERRRMELMYRGVDAAKIEERIAELRAASDEIAQRELKLMFILAKIAEDMQVQVTEEEVNARIVQIASDRGVRPDQLRNELIQNNRIMMIAQQVREHKTLDAILTKAKITDMPVEEYNSFIRGSTQGDASVELNA